MACATYGLITSTNNARPLQTRFVRARPARVAMNGTVLDQVIAASECLVVTSADGDPRSPDTIDLAVINGAAVAPLQHEATLARVGYDALRKSDILDPPTGCHR